MHRRSLSRVAIVLAAVVVLAGGLVGGFYILIIKHFDVQPPKAEYPKPRSLLEAQKQDIDYFGKLIALDRSYTPEERDRAKAKLAELKQLDRPLPPARLKVSLMQTIALADNGHSSMFDGDSSSTPLMLVEPVRVTPFSDGFYVMRAKQPYGALLGGRVMAIDGVPFDKVLKELMTLQGGTDAWRREQAADFIVKQDILYGLGIAHDPQMSSWTVVQPDGHAVTALLHASPLRGTTAFESLHWLSPKLLPAGKNWLSYSPAAGRLPESLQEYDHHFALIQVPNSCAVDIRLQKIHDSDGQEILPFLEAAESTLKAHPPCAAIVDLRGDTGGDFFNTERFSHILPRLVVGTGPIYVLTDGQTFSAAIVTTAFLKDAGGNRVKIVGEPVGDRLAFYSEGPRACLPNSNLCFYYQIAKHDLSHLCLQRDCYWRDWYAPVRVKSLQPDELIPRRFADWNEGHDAPYEWAVQAIRRSEARG